MHSVDNGNFPEITIEISNEMFVLSLIQLDVIQCD